MSDIHLTHPSPDRLAAYPLGQLDPAEAATVAAHLAECPACRAVLEALPRETLNSLAKASSATSPPPGAPTGAPAKPAKATQRAAEALPECFGPYKITKLLGRGGMGSVYLAHDPRLDRPVALKVPQFTAADGPHVRERFYREARAAARIEHPNICQVYEVGEHEGTPYLAMRYVEGKSLASLVREGNPLGQRQAAALVGKLALALQVAHASGVIHRDMKPSNVMLLKGREPIILDFGLARQVNRSEARLTKSGAVMGTPAYMAPEQAAGDPDAVGPASDVYSLGVILYELLTGKLPFEGPVAVVLAQILIGEPVRPSVHRPDLDPALEAACRKAMAKKPEDRYATMGEFAAALSAFLRGDTASPVTTPPSGTLTASPVPGAGSKAGTAPQTYRFADAPTAAPSGSAERPGAGARDTQKKEGPRPPRKKGRKRAAEPQPAGGRRWLIVGGATVAGVVSMAVVAFVLIRARSHPGAGAPPLNEVAAQVVAPATKDEPPAEAAPATTKGTTAPGAPTAKAPAPASPTEKAPPPPNKSAPPGRPPSADVAPGPENGPPPGSTAGPGSASRPQGPGVMFPGPSPRGPSSTRRLLSSNFQLRLLQWGRASATWSELAGKPLTGVIAELDPRAAGSIDFKSSNVTLTLRQAARVQAQVLFLPNGSTGLASAQYLKGAVARTGDVAVGQTKYSFQNAALGDPGRDWVYLPIFLQEGPGIEYGFLPGRRVKIGFLFEADPRKAVSLRVAGRDLPLNRAERTDTPPVLAKEEEPGKEAKPAAALEVYRFESPTETNNGAVSKNITVTEVEKGERIVTYRPGITIAAQASYQVQNRLRGGAAINGREEPIDVAYLVTALARQPVVPDALGSADIWFKAESKVGYVTLAGLRFKGSGVIKEIRKDGVLIVGGLPGNIRATDEEGNAYVSQDVRLKGEPKAITTMVKVRKK